MRLKSHVCIKVSLVSLVVSKSHVYYQLIGARYKVDKTGFFQSHWSQILVAVPVVYLTMLNHSVGCSGRLDEQTQPTNTD